MDIMSNFSERLSEFMFHAQLTTEQLGAKIGVSGSSVRSWLRKDSIIKLKHAIEVAELFNSSLNFLFGLSETIIDFTPKKAPSFYEHLKIVMKENKISRYKMCIDLEKGHGNFDVWKNGSSPLMNTVYEIAVYLDVTLDYLVGREK
ncbi:MAG: helix-turn-helix domain-containing protein [Firmicutes bacterium]|nr:helix-turn-helix domain-containing protein [Bacillota bacterium]